MTQPSKCLFSRSISELLNYCSLLKNLNCITANDFDENIFLLKAHSGTFAQFSLHGSRVHCLQAKSFLHK